MSIPIFTPNIQDNEQVTEIKGYLHEIGANDLDTSPTPLDWMKDLHLLIPHLNVCFQEKADERIDSLLNNVICLILIIPDLDVRAEVINDLCIVLSKVQGSAKNANARLSVLNNLFHGLPDVSKDRYKVYMTILSCADETTIYRVQTDTKTLNGWITQWGSSKLERRALWRAIQEVFEKAGDVKRAHAALVEVLSTYSEDDAADGRADAIKAIVSILMDEDAYTIDHLVSLKPVQFLEGELIHNLLAIFVNGNFSDYVAFTKENPQFLATHGLDENVLLSKMRILTLMGLGEAQSELAYSLVQEHLHLDSVDDLEEFIIEAVSCRAIMCKLDQEQQRILVLNTRVRSLGPEQWTAVQKDISLWQTTLSSVLENLEKLVAVPEE